MFIYMFSMYKEIFPTRDCWIIRCA